MIEAKNGKSGVTDIKVKKSPGDHNEYMYFTLPNKV